MSDAKKRKVYTAAFKAKVGLEALSEKRTLNEIAQSYVVHPVQVSQWKREIVDGVPALFETRRRPKKPEESTDQRDGRGAASQVRGHPPKGLHHDGCPAPGEERPHQSLDYQTPSVVHATAVGGGALIVDRYGNPVSQAELTSPCTGVNPVHTTLT